MAKKKIKYSFVFDAPVTIVFCLVSVIFCCLRVFVFKDGFDSKILSSPTTGKGLNVFSASQFVSYLKLFLYAFGASSWNSLFANLLFLLMLGPAMEERYGSVVIAIMMAVSIVFSGVLNACFCETSLRGCTAVIFMMIFLNSFMSFSKNKIPWSFVLIFFFYIIKEIFGIKGIGDGGSSVGSTVGSSVVAGASDANSSAKILPAITGIIICIAGGLCGSLFAFLASPKVRAEKKSAKVLKNSGLESVMTNEEKTAYLEELDSKSPRNKKKSAGKNVSKEDDDTTVIGTIKF